MHNARSYLLMRPRGRNRHRVPALLLGCLLALAVGPAAALAAPTVSVTSPSASQTVSGTVTLALDAYEATGVAQAKWYVDGVEVGWDGASPWTAAWDSRKVADGQHTIFGKAMNKSGQWGTSPVLTFYVKNTVASSTLTVRATAPAAGSTVSGTVPIVATTSDDSRVSQMKWYVDGVEVGWNGYPPWDDTWNSTSVPDGTHSIFAKALDRTTGTWVTSPMHSFTVKNATGTVSGGTAPAGWKLMVSDDFNGTSVDLNQWFIYGPNWPGNMGIGLRDGRAVSVGNGMLTITAQMINGTLVSGAIATRLNQAYGRFEFRVRTEPDPSQAITGAILTWPQSGNWPSDGENDIYETLWNQTRTPFYTFIHYGSDNRQYYYVHNADASQWHHVAMEWEPDAIRIYRDGALVWTLTDRNAIPDVLHRLCIQLDPVKSYVPNPVRMYVDWARVYARPTT